MPVITVDGKEYHVKPGENLLQACLSLGLELPYFCWHPDLGSIGSCRQCAVVQYQNADDTRGRMVMGCMTPVTDGAIFSLNGDKAKGFREAVVESLMLNHPHDCPVCAEGGECHLQDMTVMVGHRDRQYKGLKNTHKNQYLGPLIHHEMNRCITCYRCTRYYQNYAGGTDLAVMASHDHAYFGRHEDGQLESEFAGNLVEVCPTGVFTDKTLVNDYTRKWDLQSAPSVCSGCGVGCNILASERYGKLKRIHNRFNAEVNGYFLCDRGRFGAGFVNSEQRLSQSGFRNTDGRYDVISHHDALRHLVDACRNKKVVAIGSPRGSVEANYLLRTLVGSENFCPGFSSQQQGLVQHALRLQQTSSALTPDIKTIESADAMLILGEDLTHTAPRLALALRQSVRNKSYALAAELRLEPWQDAAVRNLAQDQLSPLFIAAVADTRLDDIAEQTWRLAPDDIARLGSAIALVITANTEQLAKLDLNEALLAQANNVAHELMAAQRPLIISGTSCNNKAVMTAAADIANALCGRASADQKTAVHPGSQAMLSLTVQEANSLGQAMLTDAQAPTLNSLYQRANNGDIDTLIVMENDLYRRDNSAKIDSLLAQAGCVIAIDSYENQTLSASSVALAAVSFAESEGTLVSLEGRAQRYFPVFQSNSEQIASWAWLLACLKELARPEVAEINHFDDITNACAADIPALAAIISAAPDHRYRNAGLKIPRQTHRYSGRTAMYADISVHEPKQPVDDESALAFTMEGLNSSQPGSLLPYVWAPGWNSNQSLHKFQSEVGGPLTGGTAGTRLLTDKPLDTHPDTALTPSAFKPLAGQWQLIPRHKIFGSDELSSMSPAIAEIIAPAFIEINSNDGKQLDVTDGDGLKVGDALATLEVHINNAIPNGCAAYSVGFKGTFNLTTGDSVTLAKDSQWQRQPNEPSPTHLIASDGGRHV